MVRQKWIWNEKNISTWSFCFKPIFAKEFWRLEVEDNQFQQIPLSLAQHTAHVSLHECVFITKHLKIRRWGHKFSCGWKVYFICFGIALKPVAWHVNGLSSLNIMKIHYF